MKVTFNSTFQKVSGKLGKLVYRNVGGQTIVSGSPTPTRSKQSPRQARQRDRFADAIAYAKYHLQDPLQRQWYQWFAKARGRRYDKVLVSDYLTPPEVHAFDVSGYHGQPGDIIRAIVEDDVEVVSVEIAIVAADGTKLEAGPAARAHGVWRYAATKAVPAGTSVQIVLTARDRPENETTATAKYP